MRNVLALLLCGLALACGEPKSQTIRELPSETDPLSDNVVESGNPVPQKLYDPGKTGPYTVRSYSTGLTHTAYESAIVFYPEDASRSSFPATSLSGGYTNTKEIMVWLGRHLASHGIITLIFTPTNRMSLDPKIWSMGHLGAIDQLELENKRAGSPIEGRVDVERLGVMGFSMGGAGTALAVNEAGSRLKAAVMLCPFQPAVVTAPVAMLSITGTRDTVAVPAAIERSFKASKTGLPKAFAKFNGMTHQDVAIGGAHHEDIARFATAWYQVFLADESAYQSYLNGEELAKQRINTAVFAQSGDYVFQDGDTE